MSVPPKIKHPHRPLQTDRMLAEHLDAIKSNGLAALPMLLTTYALALPPQGDLAGSLWALAEIIDDLVKVYDLRKGLPS